jgi:hypothetical protein
MVRRKSRRSPIKSSKSNTNIPVATKIFLEASAANPKSAFARLSPTNRLLAVAGVGCLFLCFVLAEEYSDSGVTRHRTPSGTPGLPLLLSSPNRSLAVTGQLVIPSLHAAQQLDDVFVSSHLPQRSPAIVVFGAHVGAFSDKMLYDVYIAFAGGLAQ